MLLWPVPLLGLLHAESSALVALTAYFVAGVSSISLFSSGKHLAKVLTWQLAALSIPLLLLTVSVFWRPNCAYAEGLLFYGLFPVPTVVFAVGLAYALTRWNVPWKRGWFIVFGVAICLGGPIYDIGFHPQFYTYNHVFGGVLGPIYDEELAVRSGLFAFRGLTLLWSAFFLLIGSLADGSAPDFLRTRAPHSGPTDDTSEATGERRDETKRSKTVAAAAAAVVAVVIGLTYAFSAQLGLNTTPDVLREALPGRLATEHFDIYYHPDVITPAGLQAVADEHEYRYRVLSGVLDVDVDERIQSFIYPDPETKADLTGARYTNVAPVWLSTPQTHVLASEFRRVFPHELAHVFSREFGLPLVNASLAVGLVEGLAVALEPPDGLPTPHEQVSAALLSSAIPAEESVDSDARRLAAVVADHLSPAGFWTGRGAVSYTTMGSFVRYLLEHYGAEPLKRVYATGNFEEVYGKPIERLASEWTDAVLMLPSVQASSGPLVMARFAVPSLFEKRCPHYVPPYRRLYRTAATALVRGDSSAAIGAAEASLEHQSRYLPSLDLWARLSLAYGEADAVLRRLASLPPDSMTAALLVRLGDAHALTGDSIAARFAYDRALDKLPTFAHEEVSRVRLRMAASGREDVIAMLVGAGPAQTAGGPDDAIAATARALALARDNEYELAARLLRTTPSVAEPSGGAAAVLRRRRLVWLAQFHYHAGAHSAAATYAEEAADAYRTAGAFNEAAQLDDFRDMVRWLASRSVASRQVSVSQ